MENLNSIRKILTDHKEKLAQKYGLSSLAIFGSFARNEQTANSDVDILVEFNKPIGIEFIDLAEELEEILKIKVDLVSKNGVKKNYLEVITKDLSYV